MAKPRNRIVEAGSKANIKEDGHWTCRGTVFFWRKLLPETWL